MKKSAYLIILLIILAILYHLLFLGMRPLHHDEGVNYFFTKMIIEKGTFEYDPFNYHGPFYFFIILFSFNLLGISEFSLRLPTALFGIILAILPLFLKERHLYNKYILSLFLIISPSILYYSRYAIHESSFILFTFISIYLFTRILEKKELSNLPLFAISLAFLFTIKETVIIPLFIIFILCIANYKVIREIKFKNQFSLIFLSIFLFLIIYIILFTSLFTNLQGLSDSIKGYLPWTARGLKEPGHAKPFFYYLKLIIKYELPILILAIIGILGIIKNRTSIFLKNIIIWFILTYFIYSLINYKTPWLIINISLPMIILASIGINAITNKRLKFILTILTIIYLILSSTYTNFISPWQPSNLYAYVHTYQDTLNLVDNLNSNYKPDSKILIISKDYWPLPFYLDGKNVSYLDNIQSINYSDYSDYDILIVKEDLFQKDPPSLEYSYSKYSLREGVALYLLVRK